MTSFLAVVHDGGISIREHGLSDGMALLMELPPARRVESGFPTPEAARAWAEQWLTEHPLPPLAPPCPRCGAGLGEAHVEEWGDHGWQLRDGCTEARRAARSRPDLCGVAQSGIKAARDAEAAEMLAAGNPAGWTPEAAEIRARRASRVEAAIAPLRAACDATAA